MKGIQLKRKIFHWEPLKIFSLSIWPRGRDEDRRGTRLPFGARNFCRTFTDRRFFVFCRNNFLECPVTVRSRLCTCHWIMEGVGFCGGLYLPERGSLSLKAQLAFSCVSPKSPRPGIGMLGRSLATGDWEWLVCLVRDIFCETFRFGITALSFLFRKCLWEIQQLFKGTRHDNRAQLVEGERSYFTPGAVSWTFRSLDMVIPS